MLRRSSALPDQPATPCEVPVWGQCTLPRFIQALFIRKVSHFVRNISRLPSI